MLGIGIMMMWKKLFLVIRKMGRKIGGKIDDFFGGFWRKGGGVINL
jgi:hypothetical protein